MSDPKTPKPDEEKPDPKQPAKQDEADRKTTGDGDFSDDFGSDFATTNNKTEKE